MIRLGRLAFAAAVLMPSVAAAFGSVGAPLRIVAFGTSLTARGGWQAPLEAALQRCLARPVRVETVALSGSTSQWALGRIEAVASLRPNIVLVEFAANDAALDRFLWLAESRENMAGLFDGLRQALPEATIYSMGMNPAIGLRGWLRPYLDDYVEAHRALAVERGFGFVDFRPIWNAMPEGELEAAIPDGSHPRTDVASAVIVPELVRRLAGDCRDIGASTSGTVKDVSGERAP